ncbi:class I SAM-dependent methyltransferase [Mycoplasma leonicaptivi]|uniref:class I SAM-dependent methyltransferase n=1 Tax=Mycoplasma leonicaptivi TaxID=36742 RepID=UPI00048997C2|nr:class I SAM-dependent methyltransferase [Mycoplasma leonicaptivi]
MNKNDKQNFHKLSTIQKYLNATINIGLWKSESYIIKSILPNKNSKILDLGCGTGRTSFGLYNLGYQNITAIDISSTMIETAKKINSTIFKTNIDFKRCDASCLPYNDLSFDFAFFSFNGFPGIPSHKSRIKVLQEIYRVLKKNSYFIFTAHKRDEVQYQRRKFLNLKNCEKEFKLEQNGDYIYINSEGNCDFMHLFSETELKTFITKYSKFKVIKIVDRDQNFLESKDVLEFSDNTFFLILKK